MIARPAVIFLAIMTMLIVVAPATSQEAVRMRAAAHKDFGRLVFDWPKPVKYTARIQGQNLVIRFERPLKASFGSVVAALDRYVSKATLSGDGRTVTIALKGKLAQKSFATGKSVVVDLRAAKDTAAAKPKSKTAAAKSAPEPAKSGAGPKLRIRVGDHPGYVRLVFDWKTAVKYTIDQSGGRMSIRFNRPARVDIADLRRRLDGDVSKPAVRNNGKSLTLSVAVPETAGSKHFRAGTKVVLDIVRNAKKKTAAKPKSEPKPDKKSNGAKPAETKVAKGPMRILPKKTTKPAVKPKTQDAAAPSAPKQDTAKKDAPRKEETGPAKTAEEKAAKKADEKPVETAKAETSASKPDEEDVAAAILIEKKKPFKGPAPDPVTLVFQWPEPVGAAVFRRGEYLWIVFDKRTPLDLAPLRQASRTMVRRIEQLPVSAGTVVRLFTRSDEINPKAFLKGNNWAVELALRKIETASSIGFEVKQSKDRGIELEVKLDPTAQVMRVPDPAVGDLLQIATSRVSGQGLAGERAFPEFQILASAQGLVIEPLSDDMALRKTDKGLFLAGGPQGLHISSSTPFTGSMAQAQSSALGVQIMQVADWQRGDMNNFLQAHETLLRSVIEVPRSKRDKARIALARFYFSHGMGVEALAILKVTEFNNIAESSKPKFVALKGAAMVLAEKYKRAARVLGDPRLDRFQDVVLWRAATAAKLGDLDSAAEFFKLGEGAIVPLPHPIKGLLANLFTAVALDVEDLKGAEKWVTALTEEADKLPRAQLADMNYNKGRLARIQRDIDTATKAWQSALESGDTWSASRADLALVDLGLQQETMQVDQAIERLERLRYAWRGDALEQDVLKKLGELYFSKNDYRNGLAALRVIVTYYPKEDVAREIALQMSDVFKQLYLEGASDDLAPLTALGLYDEFRELTPAGDEGNQMIQLLAERLVSVDLLGRATQVLQHQIKFRLRGAERATVGTRLAQVRLLARDPKGALNALRDSFYPRIDPAVEDDRRRIRAKAMFELNRDEDAISLLAGDISWDADLLRREIYWRAENWSEAAKVLQRLSGDPPEGNDPIPDDRTQYVLNWAVALRLNNDFDGLTDLRQRYGKAMQGSSVAETFEFIVSDTTRIGTALDSVAQQMAEVDQVEAFLANFRKQLQKPKETEKTPPQPATPQGATPPEGATPPAGAAPPLEVTPPAGATPPGQPTASTPATEAQPPSG